MMFGALLKRVKNLVGHATVADPTPLHRIGAVTRQGLSEQELEDYAESKLNHVRFVKDQLMFEGQALVPVDSLEWIVPGLNTVWRAKDRLVFYRVPTGVTIKVVRPESIETRGHVIGCCVFH